LLSMESADSFDHPERSLRLGVDLAGFFREARAEPPPNSQGEQVAIEAAQHHEVLSDRWACEAFFRM